MPGVPQGPAVSVGAAEWRGAAEATVRRAERLTERCALEAGRLWQPRAGPRAPSPAPGPGPAVPLPLLRDARAQHTAALVRAHARGTRLVAARLGRALQQLERQLRRLLRQRQATGQRLRAVRGGLLLNRRSAQMRGARPEAEKVRARRRPGSTPGGPAGETLPPRTERTGRGRTGRTHGRTLPRSRTDTRTHTHQHTLALTLARLHTGWQEGARGGPRPRDPPSEAALLADPRQGRQRTRLGEAGAASPEEHDGEGLGQVGGAAPGGVLGPVRGTGAPLSHAPPGPSHPHTSQLMCSGGFLGAWTASGERLGQFSLG